MQDETYATAIDHGATGLPETRQVSAGAVLRWIREGTRDLMSAPLLSLGFGAVFALLGAVVSYGSTEFPKLSLTFFTAFVLVGPFLATGLYRTAQQRARAGGASATESLSTLKSRVGPLSVYVLVMLLFTIAWMRITTIAVALNIGTVAPNEGLLTGLFSMNDGGLELQMLLGGSLIVYALSVYALSALSLPMIVDGKASAIPAMITSVRTVVAQPRVMLPWALVVAVMTLAGLATFFVGLAVIFPILGYAAWHSYRDLIT